MSNTIDPEFVCKKASEGCSLLDIAHLLGMEESVFMELIHRDKILMNQYKKGVAETAHIIKSKVIDFAKKGSPVAQQQYLKILENQIANL